MLYDVAFFIFSIFYLPTLIFKGRLHGDFLERLGIFDKQKIERLKSGSGRIWIQAVSVGEVALCKSLIPLLKKQYPGKEIVLSTITKRGNEFACNLFSKDSIIIYFPLDFSFVVRKVSNLIRPDLYIMIETEIWPNLLRLLAENKVLSVIVNGRISDRSFGKYKIVRYFLKDTLDKIGLYCMRGQADAARIIDLGASPERVMVTGNMKFDAMPNINIDEKEKVRNFLDLREGDLLFVGGSTHPGEEEKLLSVYKRLRVAFPGLKLLIAPRHIERAGEAADIVRRYGFESVRYSSSLPIIHCPGSPVRVFILDTIGLLNAAYSYAALVFVGGSLVRHGGQNPIEPAALEKPSLFGPHMSNFMDAALALTAGKGALEVGDEGALFQQAESLLADPGLRAIMGKNAFNVVVNNRGSSARNILAIKEVAAKHV